jgi:hypothetical protein
LGLTFSFSIGSKTSNNELQIASLVSKNTLEVLLGSNNVAIKHIVIFTIFKHANQGTHPQLYAMHGLLNKGTTSYMGPKAILGGYVQSQMHALKEAIDILGIIWGFHGYGDILRV